MTLWLFDITAQCKAVQKKSISDTLVVFLQRLKHQFSLTSSAINKGCNPQQLLRLAVFDGPLMFTGEIACSGYNNILFHLLSVPCPQVTCWLFTVHPKRNKFVTGVKIKAMGESKLNDCPANCYL